MCTRNFPKSPRAHKRVGSHWWISQVGHNRGAACLLVIGAGLSHHPVVTHKSSTHSRLSYNGKSDMLVSVDQLSTLSDVGNIPRQKIDYPYTRFAFDQPIDAAYLLAPQQATPRQYCHSLWLVLTDLLIGALDVRIDRTPQWQRQVNAPPDMCRCPVV
jgi:hypothetical protein